MTLDAIQGGRGLMVYGLEVVIPGATLRVAKAPYTSVSGGHYDGVGESFGSISRAVSGRDGQLPAVEATFSFWDHDRTWQRVLAGVTARSVRGSAATLYRMAPTLNSSQWSKAFEGQIVRWGLAQPFLVRVVARTNDEQILRPSRQVPIDRNTWPNAFPEVYSKVGPVLFGYHDSSTQQVSPGLVPCLLVDQSIYRYLLCVGRAKSVLRVFVNGTQISSSLYSTSYVTVKGRIYTTILFDTAADALSAGVADADGVAVTSAVVTCDAEGYESVGDGSGSLVTNPTTQLSMFLSNFVLDDYLTGNWLSSSLLDSTLFTAEAAVMTALTAGGSFYKADRITGREAIALYCQSFERRCFWSRNFKIGLDGEKVFTQPYLGNVIAWTKVETKPFAFEEKDWRITSEITERQCYSPSQDAFLQTLTLQDAAASIVSVSEVDRLWSEAR